MAESEQHFQATKEQQNDFHLVETDSFLLVSECKNPSRRSDTSADAIPQACTVYYQTMLRSKSDRKRKLQKRFQRFSEVLWFGKIVRNIVKLKYERIIKRYENELSNPVGSLKNVECLDSKIDALEIRAAKLDIKNVRGKLSIILYGNFICKVFTKTSDSGYETSKNEMDDKDLKYLNNYKNLAKIEGECENLETLNENLTKEIIFTTSQMKEMENAIDDFRSLVGERRYRKKVELSEKRWEEERLQFEHKHKIEKELLDTEFASFNEGYQACDKLLEDIKKEQEDSEAMWRLSEKRWAEAEDRRRKRSEAFQEKLKLLEESIKDRQFKRDSEKFAADGEFTHCIIIIVFFIIILLIFAVSALINFLYT